jgi:RecA/RadA recombinase
MAKPSVQDIQAKTSRVVNKTKSKIFTADAMPDFEDLEYVVMPEWWQKATNTKGLPFRKIVMLAGDSDSGKTSASIAAVKAAQEQGVKVLYVETEGKTTKQDFVNWGVNPKELSVLQESVVENIYDDICGWIDDQSAEDPDTKILLIIDSIGSVISKHDASRSMADSGTKPGGKGKSNREGLNKIIAKRTQHDIALLLINYTYDNIGSPGKTNAGGKAVNFFSSLTYQTSRKGWYEATVKGVKVRKGAFVTWKLFKNHIDRSNTGPKVVEFKITADGFELVGGSDEGTDS